MNPCGCQVSGVAQDPQNALQRQRDAARASVAEEQAPPQHAGSPETPVPNNTGSASGAAEERHVTQGAAAPEIAQPEVQICMAPHSLYDHITCVL